MSDVKTSSRPAAAYDTDFYAWTQDQAEKIRARRHNELDWENLAEEIESVGRSEKRQLRSRLEVVLLHLLRWQHQPAKRKYGWRVTIGYQRRMINSILKDSPSLRRFPSEVIGDCYQTARIKAIDETDLSAETFPLSCSYALDEILDDAFFPGPLEPDIR